MLSNQSSEKYLYCHQLLNYVVKRKIELYQYQLERKAYLQVKMGRMILKTNALFSNGFNITNQYDYSMAIQDLQNDGCISLDNIQKLSYTDLQYLCEEIKFWCIYGNQDARNLNLRPRAAIPFTVF